MGVIGQLFNKHDDFKAEGKNVSDEDLAKYGYGANQGLSGQAGQATSSLAGQLGMNGQASQMGLGAAQQGFDQSNLANTRQSELALQLADRAAGRGGPSIAEQQLSQSLGQVQQQGAGAMAAARGVSPGTAARLIGSQQTMAAQQAAGQGAILRSQEQQAAQNQLGNVLAQQRQGALGQSQIGYGGFGAGQQAGAQGAQVLGGLSLGQNAGAASLAQGNQNAAMHAQDTNAGISKANTAGDNATGGSILNAAGGMLGLAHGGVVPPAHMQAPAAHAEGAAPSLAEALMHSHRHLSSAHEALAKFASGGEVHGSYDFEPLDVRQPDSQDYGKGLDVSQPKDESGAERQARQGTEEKDSRRDAGTASDMDELAKAAKGKKQTLHLADGGEVDPEETQYERQLRERQEARERARDKQTKNDMDSLEESSMSAGEMNGIKRPGEEVAGVQHKAIGGIIGKAVGAIGDLFKGHDANEGYGPMSSHAEASSPAFRAGASAPSDLASDESAGMDMSAPSQAGAPAQEGNTLLASQGGPIPGQAKVQGNSLKNDTVPTMLSPGEVVLPRTISHDPNAAAEFVKHINARKMSQGGQVGGYGHVLKTQQDIHNRLCALEKRMAGGGEVKDPKSALNDSDADGANSSEARAGTARGEDWALPRSAFQRLDPKHGDAQYDWYYRHRGEKK